MKTGMTIARAIALGAIMLCSTGYRAMSAEPCDVPGYLLFGDSLLQRATAAVGKDKTLKIVVLGGTSSTLPGPDGAAFAYPMRLEAALKNRLPGLDVTVVVEAKPRQFAADMVRGIEKLILDHKPSLAIWQAGSYDAMRGTDLAEFNAAISDGVEKFQAKGTDVVLVNMQYSPRTESIVGVGAYADGLRWVAREREVPLFDRLAIMRHWYDAGQFNLYATTKDLTIAKNVHDCVGRTLALLIIDAARLEIYDKAASK
jgi:hypothetical protein